jgi:3-hydroxybutyrate dehydrogenase
MKSVVITGSSSGIGRACALTLDRRGFRVFAGVRKQADGDALRSVASDSLVPMRIDVTDPASIQAVAEQVADEVSDEGLHGLVNNAGTTLACPIEHLPLDEFRHQLEINLVGPLAVTQAMLPLLQRAGGRVVNVTSAAGRAAVPLMAPYVAAKHGLEGLSKVIALEGAAHGVTSNCVNPAYVRTPLVEDQIAAQAATHGMEPDEVVERVMLAPVAIKRLVEPEEVAELVAYLCAPQASFITGASITIDGGWTAH